MQGSLIEIGVYLVGNLFSIYITSLFFHMFFHVEATKKRKIFRYFSYLLYFGISSIVVLLINRDPTTNLLIAILGTAMVSMTYDGKWKYRALSIITIFATQVVCEDLSYYILKKLDTIHIFSIGVVVSQLMTFIIVLLIKKSIDLKKGEEIRFTEWISIMVIPICSFAVSVWVLDDCKSETIASLGGVGVVLINISTFYIVDRMQKMYRKQLDYLVLEQQNKAYMQQMLIYKESEEKISSLRHDIKNHLFALNQLAKEKDCDKIKKYLENLLLLSGSEDYIVLTGNYLIDGFLNVKLKEAMDLGVEVSTELQIPQNFKMEEKDISIILGNILDNAVDALKFDSTIGEEKILEVVMKASEGKLFIKVCNSYSGKIKKNGYDFITTKKERRAHGIGLKNVQRIVSDYHGHMEIDYDGNLFSIMLILFLN